MPKLKEYNNTQDFSGDPIAGAARSQEQAGYYGGAAIRQGFEGISEGIKGAEQHIAQNETSKLAADLATAHAELADQWRDAVQHADPNDHELASRFMEQKVKPRLAGLGDGLITEQAQQAHERASAGLTAELFTKSAADQANLAGEAAIANLDTMRNQYSNVVRNDPTALNSVQALTQASIDGLVAAHGLPREAALKLSNQVLAENAKSAAYGAADLNPDEAKASLARGDYDKWLDGTTVKSISNYADQRKEAKERDARAAETEQQKQEVKAASKVATSISASVIDEQTGEERLPPDFNTNIVSYSKMPGASDSDVRALRALGQSVLRAPVLTSDGATKANFNSRLWLQDGDPNKLTLTDINEARGTGLLSKSDYSSMRTSILDSNKDPQKTANMREFAKSAASFKSFISKSSLLSTDADGDIRYGQFQQEKSDQFQQGLKAGVSAKDMLDPRSSNYLFRDVQRYKPTADIKRFQDSIQGTAAPIGPASLVPWAAAPAYHASAPNARPSTLSTRKPGESMDDYLKRAQ